MSVVLTGVGYIGAPLAQRLIDAGQTVIAIENFFSTDSASIRHLLSHHCFRLIEGSIADLATVDSAFSDETVTTVFHLAAQASASPQAAPARYTEETNLLAPRLLLDAMVKHNVPRIVFASSFKVYDRHLPPLVTEETPYGAFSDLSHLSKCYTEKLMEMYAGLHGLTAVSLRLGITHGLSPVMKRDARFMTAPNKFCLQCAAGEEIQLYPGSHLPAGFIHVDDAADLLIEADTRQDLQGYLPVNAVTEVLSVSQVAEAVVSAARTLGLDARVRFVDARDETAPGYDVQVRSRFQDYFDQPRRQLRDSAGAVIEHFRA